MLRTTVTAAIALIAFNGAPWVHADDGMQPASICEAMPSDIKEGEYFKVCSKDVSGAVENNHAPNQRGPCPGLNALSNHGYFPRNGSNIKTSTVPDVLEKVYNVAREWTNAQLTHFPDTFSLSFISRRDRDASFARSDRYFKQDPAVVNSTLAKDFLNRANPDGKIMLEAVAKARLAYAATCKVINPECNFNETVKTTAFRQAALLLTVIGHTRYIQKSLAESFLIEERLPDSFTKSATPITTATLTDTLNRLIEATK